VKLEYSTDGGATFPNVMTASFSNTGSFSWTIPNTISSAVKVRVSDAADASASDVSDANFKIRGAVTVTAPNGGEIFSVGESRSITWTTSGTIPNVRLEYSKDNFVSLVLIAASAPGTGSYAWTIPDDISSTVKVRITDAADSTVFDDSNAAFRIQGKLTLTAPNGGEKWKVGSAQSITWTSVGSVANVKLQYSKDNFATATLITASTPNTGSFTWTIPNDMSSTVKIRVTDASDVSVFDDSNANFKLMAGFTVTAPNGGEVWKVGEGRIITWTTSGTVANVRLDYSRDNFVADIQNITLSIANTGSQAWTIPDTVGAGKIRVSDASDPDAFDTSDTDFRIRAAFTLTSPDGGEQWLVGSVRTITWTNVGSVPNVRLEYSKNDFLTIPTVIAASVPNTGSYDWTIPNDIAATVKVRVSDPNDPEANDASNANFRITASFALASANLSAAAARDTVASR